jgi:hypothetical protein
MTDIFKVVRDLIDSRFNVLSGNAVNDGGELYGDSVESLKALDALEPSLLELIDVCLANGIMCKALGEVIELVNGAPEVDWIE